MTPTSSVGKAWAKRTPSVSRQDGFTLIELIVVMILVGMLAGLVTPIVMSVLDRTQRNSAVNNLAAFLRSTRTQAVSMKTPIVFKGDLEENRYWWFNPETEETSDVHFLKGKIRLSEFEDAKDSTDRGIFSITFYPLGNNSGGLIHLNAIEDGKENEAYQLKIDPVTGRPQVLRES